MIFFVKVKGSVADSSGKIMQGDQIVDVNGQDLTTCTQEFAARVLKVYFSFLSWLKLLSLYFCTYAVNALM